MPNNGWLEKMLRTFGYGKGVDALYRPETYEPIDGIKAISGFELEIGLPKIIANPPQPIPLNIDSPKEIRREYRPMFSKIDDKKLSRIEEQIKEILQTLKSMKDFNESVKIEIQEITESIGHMERSIGELDDIREGYSSVEKNLRELSVLYDLVSAQFNPFIDTELLEETIPQSGLSSLIVKEEDKTYINDLWTLKWIEFLNEKTKQNQIPNLLSYYKKIGWIDDEIENKVLTYLSGSKTELIEGLEEDEVLVEEEDEEAWKLSIDEHTKSLVFIERIKGKKLDEQNIMLLEKETSKLKTGVGVGT